MKKLFLAAICFTTLIPGVLAQKYMTRTGKVNFDATTPKSPEKIEAVNNEVATILDAKSGELLFQVLVKSFKFERELMQEHFNENYMESDKYPKSTFKGSITDLKNVNFTKDGTYNVTVSGSLGIHGENKSVSVPGTLSVKGKTVSVKAKFTIVLADYGISVPGVVADKVSKQATINVDSDMELK